MGDFDLRSRFQKFGGLSLGASLWIWTWAPASKIQTPEFLIKSPSLKTAFQIPEILEKYFWNDFWNGVLAWGTLVCVPDSRNLVV